MPYCPTRSMSRFNDVFTFSSCIMLLQTRCLSCHGDGWYTDSSGYKERCFYCQSSTHGHGRQDCLKCNAKGRVACPPCDSYGQIRCFIRLTITWWVLVSPLQSIATIEMCAMSSLSTLRDGMGGSFKNLM